MNNQLRAGQLVQVTARRSLAFGRYGRVLMSAGDQAQIRFADLPKSVSSEPNPTGFVQTFDCGDLTSVEDIPIAAFYLLVTVSTLVETQAYTRYAIAHGDIGQAPKALADTVVARFFGSLGDFDGEAYIWENTPYSASLSAYEEITVADYISLSRTTPDYDLGVRQNR